MAITNGNLPLINRKVWQFMTPTPTASVAGSFVISNKNTIGLLVTGATTQYGYDANNDARIQIPNMALAGTFGAGACGTYHNDSNTITANGGSTTTITTATAIVGTIIGAKIRILSGTQIGKEVTVTSVNINPGGTNTITFTPALSGTISNGDTFKANTGRFFIMNAGTTAAGIFKSFDILTGIVTSLGITNLPASWGTDGKMVTTPSFEGVFASGTATAGGASTITNSAKTWTTNQWTNYQIRITSGTGVGQIRTIASNTSTAITVGTAWTTTPDATSVYSIEGNDDYIYLLGNNAVTMYRFSISGNTWTVMSPTTARAAAPIAGMSANWIVTGNSIWANESDIKDGRYIYSLRGGSSTLDRFDITGGTAGAGAWATITYAYANETFSTGSSTTNIGEFIYIRKDATHRYFRYSVVNNNIYPFSTNLYGEGIALLGDKLWIQSYYDGTTRINFIYSLLNSGNVVHRCMLF